jgi:cytochrome c553
MADYKSGARTTSVPGRAPQANMIALSKLITDEEVGEAAAYCSALKPRHTVRVLETPQVPKTRVAGWFLALASFSDVEPIGQRVIEVPENLEQFENRDTRSRFVAYVPPGSITRGKALVHGVPGKTDRCAICHGPDLKGLAGIPPIVGRSPSYTVRQLFDFQTGARNGAAAALMKPMAANLGEAQEMIVEKANKINPIETIYPPPAIVEPKASKAICTAVTICSSNLISTCKGKAFPPAVSTSLAAL